MASIMEVIVKGIDEITPVINKVSSETAKVNAEMQKNWTTTGKQMQGVGIACTALGAGIELLARSNAPLIELTQRLASNLGITEKAMRDLVISTSDVTLPLNEVLTLMDLGTKQGLESAEALKEYALFWDMVGDATGESSTALAGAGVALKALGITAGEEGQTLSAFGFIQKNTTMQLSEFINMVGRLGPQMRAMNMDINDAAIIMGILQQEFGMTARVSIAEFRKAVTESGGDIEKLKTSLGITSEMFSTYTAKLEESSTVIKENSDRHAELSTNVQKLQHWLSELKYGFSNTIASAAGFAPLLTGIGSAMTILGTIMKTQLYANLMLSIQGIQAMGISVLGLVANYAMAGVALAIWVKVYQGVIQVINDAKIIREAEAASIIAQADANDKLQKAYNLTSEEMIKVNQNLKDGKNSLDGIREPMDVVTTSTVALGTSAGEATPILDEFGNAIEGVGTKAAAVPAKLDEVHKVWDEFGRKANEVTLEWTESFDDWAARMDENRKKVVAAAKETFGAYTDAMKPVKDRIDELTLSEGEYALKILNTTDALKERRKELESNVKAADLSAEEEKKAMEDIAEWYDLEITEILKKLKEKRDALIATAKQAGSSASVEYAAIKKITDAYNNQIGTLGALASAKAKAAATAATKIYKVVDKEGNILGLRSQNILSKAESDAGIKLIAMHSGGQVRTTIPGGEGLALLKDEEIVRTPKEENGKSNQINLVIQEGAFKFTGSKIDESSIKNSGKIIFDEFISQCRAHNIILARG
jgi:negative regulator of sigma E activity